MSETSPTSAPVAGEARKAGADQAGVNELELQDPVQFGSELVTKLVFQPIVGAMLRRVKMPKIDKASQEVDVEMDYFLTIASNATGRPPSFFDRCSMRDTLAIVGYVGSQAGPS